MVASEVVSILKAVEQFAVQRGFWSSFAETKLEKFLLLIATVSLALAIPLVFVEPLRNVALLAGLVFLLSVLALVLVQAFVIVATLHSPLKGYAEAAAGRLKQRADFVSSLGKFPSESLSLAKRILESDAQQIQQRIGLLIGAIEKIGFIPAGLALYYAALQAPPDTANMPSNILMAFVLGLYGGAFIGHRLVGALRFNVTCLEEAQAISVRREALHQPSKRLQPAGQRPAVEA
ncbi:MAG: hypothetical protein C0462_04700 [Alcanivorax sp.]|nr:hypothetical protein [Alcanivorax sp.]